MYYFLLANNITQEEYLLIKNIFNQYVEGKITLHSIKKNYISLITNKNSRGINKASFFEFITFLHYIKTKKISPNNVILVKNFNLIISDNTCSIYIENKAMKISKSDTFISLRNYLFNWIYELLNYFTNIIIFDRKTCFFFDKLSVINKILYKGGYHELKKIYGDISILRINSTENLVKIVEFLQDKYYKFVIKTTNSEMGQWVYTFDTENKTLFELKIYNFLQKQIKKPLIIIPFFNIKTEYRVYYTYIKNKIKFYSIKIKANKNLNEAFQKGQLALYKNLDVTRNIWEYKNFWEKKLDFLRKVITSVYWNVGVLEFIETENNELYLMEINHLGGLLPYDQQDLENLEEFYLDLYKHYLSW